MTNLNNNVRLQKVNAGGIFFAIAKGALQPISAIVLVPLAIICPPLVASIFYHIFKNQDDRVFNLKKGLFKAINFKLVTILEIIYIFLMYLLLRLFAIKANEYLQTYIKVASEHAVLQLGTKEQLLYNQNLVNLMALLLIAFLVIFIGLSKYVFLKNYQANCALNVSFLENLKSIAIAFFKNLPTYIFFLIGFLMLLEVIESFYARFKLIYLEGYILNQENFDPTILFLVVRLYTLHIAFYALLLFSYVSLGLKSKITFRRTKTCNNLD